MWLFEAVLPSLAAPSGEVGLQCVDSLPERDAERDGAVSLSSASGARGSLCRFRDTGVRMVNSLRTMDVFPTCEMSPDVSYYEPATSPVIPALPVDSNYVLPGGSVVNG